MLTQLVVDEFTTPTPINTYEGAAVRDVISLMEQHGVRHIPVVDDLKKPIGVISERDITLALSLRDKLDILASEIMSVNPYTVYAETPIDEVALNMSKRKIGSALVVNQAGELQGMFTSTDALNALIEVVRGQT